MSSYTRQYDRLSRDERRTRDRKIAFVWIAFVALVLFVILGWIWLATGHSPHHLTPLTIILVIMTIILWLAWHFATEVPVKSSKEERMLNVLVYCFGIVLVIGYLPMCVILLTRALAGGS